MIGASTGSQQCEATAARASFTAARLKSAKRWRGSTRSRRAPSSQQVLTATLPEAAPGGAIVYCSSRVRIEEIAAFLREKGLAAGHFHAGLPPQSKKDTQQRFIDGELRVMVATNAFGMGIDKPDVRLVIHADVPGSLENYLQEAGRASGDRAAARCVLMYAPDDVERQFGLSARSRLKQHEIQAILKSLRNLDRRKRLGGEVVATAGEILLDEHDGAFDRDSVTDDTRVRTAIAWLEESKLLTREENVVQIFPSSLRVGSIDEARVLLERSTMRPAYRLKLLAIVDALLAARADEGISTDELMMAARLDAQDVRRAMSDLEAFGIASNDLALTAFVHVGVERSSARRLERAQALEAALIDELRLAPRPISPSAMRRCPICVTRRSGSRTRATPMHCPMCCGAVCAASRQTGASTATASRAWVFEDSIPR